MEETIVLIDDGFLSKLSKHFGQGTYLKFDKIKFAKNLAEKKDLFCKYIYFYTAPPFRSKIPTKEELVMYKGYRKFIKKLSENKMIIIREGRCQRLKIDGKFIYKQKAVDSLTIIDLMSIPLDYPNIKKIVLIASDSDFVPVINKLKELSIQTILYTYYEKGRKAIFSTSNELIKSVKKYVLLSKEDFTKCLLNEKTK